MESRKVVVNYWELIETLLFFINTSIVNSFQELSFPTALPHAISYIHSNITNIIHRLSLGQYKFIIYLQFLNYLISQLQYQFEHYKHATRTTHVYCTTKVVRDRSEVELNHRYKIILNRFPHPRPLRHVPVDFPFINNIVSIYSFILAFLTELYT